MITGVVNTELEANLRLTLRGPNGQVRHVRAIIDTGFDGCLTLPPALIAELGLRWHRTGCAILADGSATTFDVFRAVILWDRRRRCINVDEADTTPLVGTGLLEHFEVHAQFRPRGKVTIKPLRRRRSG